MHSTNNKISSNKYNEHYFLQACNGYEQFSEQGNILPKRILYAIRLLQPKMGEYILDIGCGRGELLKYLAQRGVMTIGIDYAVASMKISNLSRQSTKKEGFDYSLLNCEAELLPFKDKSIDKVTMLDIVEHLFPDELEKTLKNINRIMKEDGLLIIHTMPNGNYYKWGYPIYRKFMNVFGRDLPLDPRLRSELGETHVNIQTPTKLRAILKKCGFKKNKLIVKQIDGNLLKKLICGNPIFKGVLANDIFYSSKKS